MKPKTELRDETRALLLNRPVWLSTNKIAAELGISTAWINAFARGEIENPGVVTIETLNHFLKRLAFEPTIGKKE